MALLQISEPGQSAAPHQHKLAVGIDLGTTNSLVATVRSGLSSVLIDDDGHALLPSVVRYMPDGNTEVGYSAQAAQSQDPANTIISAKRFMGRGLKDIDVSLQPYHFVDNNNEMLQIETRAGIKSPVEVSAEAAGGKTSPNLVAVDKARGRQQRDSDFVIDCKLGVHPLHDLRAAHRQRMGWRCSGDGVSRCPNAECLEVNANSTAQRLEGRHLRVRRIRGHRQGRCRQGRCLRL